jgi:folate-binding protein YgfZ
MTNADATTTLDDLAGQLALRSAVGAVAVERDVIRASGADATTFLQGQISQDVARLAVGDSAWSFVLQPQGKVDAWFRVTRVADDQLLLDVDGGFGPQLVARLERFKLRVDLQLEPLAWQAVSLRGPAVAELDLDAAVAEVVADAEWPGAPGVDLLGPSVVVPSDVPWCAPESLEALRIEAGVPAMGRELTEDTIPEASGVVARSVSFSKGCYTGQELVARIDSRGGNVPSRLCGVVVPGLLVPPPAGAHLLVDDDEVAQLTSTARSRALDAAVGLAYLPRKVELPGAASVDWGDGFAAARLIELPLA